MSGSLSGITIDNDCFPFTVVLDRIEVFRDCRTVGDIYGAVGSCLTPKYVIRQPAVPIVYADTKPYWQIYKELGEKMGLGDYFQFKDMKDYLTQQLAPVGLTLDQMKETGVWTPPGMKPFYVRAKDPKHPWITSWLTKVKRLKSSLERLMRQVVH